MLLKNILGGNQMPEVDRIETPAEKTNFHKQTNVATRATVSKATFWPRRRPSQALTENCPSRFLRHE